MNAMINESIVVMPIIQAFRREKVTLEEFEVLNEDRYVESDQTVPYFLLVLPEYRGHDRQLGDGYGDLVFWPEALWKRSFPLGCFMRLSIIWGGYFSRLSGFSIS